MKHIEKLNQSIETYKAIQIKHLSCFNTDLLPVTKTMNFERAAVFSELKNYLDQFLNFSHSETNIDLISFYQSELNDILGTDQILRERINEHKDKLKQHMGDISHSKKAIRKYAKSTGQTIKKTICFSG